ncbi:MAG TPA: hypothetical protein VKR32_02690 [Puia sp.]|nr:hypothetical protein [Puia sp.]
MHDATTYKLLGHLYQIVPAQESQSTISKEVFSEENNAALDASLHELVDEGYVYEWRGIAENSAEYGMTPKGIVFYDHYLEDSKHPLALTINREPPEPVIEKIERAALAESAASQDQDQEQKRPFSIWRIIPVIVLIIFAVGLVYVITRLRNK